MKIDDFVTKNKYLGIWTNAKYQVFVHQGTRVPFSRAVADQKLFEKRGLFQKFLFEQTKCLTVMVKDINTKNILGYAVLFGEQRYIKARNNATGYLGVWVHPDHRKQGISKYLLSTLERNIKNLIDKDPKFYADGENFPKSHMKTKVLSFRDSDFTNYW